MTNENEELFNELEDVESPEVDEDEDTLPEETSLKPIVSSESPAELEEKKGVKKEMDGKTLTIKSVEILPPRTKELKDGVFVDVEPSTALTGTKLYPSKLKVRFTEDNLVEYYPGINFFLKRDGSINNKVSLNRKGNNTVSKLVKKTLLHMAKSKGIEIKTTDLKKINNDKTFQEFSKITSDGAILDYLVGKKVKIKMETGTYRNKEWFRNDIEEILN